MGTNSRQLPAPAALHGGRVALLGLPPECAAALGPALAAVGVPGTVTAELAHLPEVLALPDLTALVAPQSAVGDVLASTGGETSLSLAVVLVLRSPRPQDCAAALQDGATGLIVPGSDVDDAATVVRLALLGRTVLPRALATAMSTSPGLPSVSAQERQWLRTLAVGGTVGVMARDCAHSEPEMYRRLSALYARLGAADRTAALLAAQRLGLLADGEHASTAR